MKWLMLSACLLSGCFYLGQNTHKDIVVHASSTWSGPELLTVIMEATNHNLYDTRTNIKAIATPYYPSIVKAIGRRAQLQYHWSETEFRNYVNPLIYEGSGAFVDWEKESEPVYDHALKPLHTSEQFDRLMFLLVLRNLGWPCGKKLTIFIPGVTTWVIPLDQPDCQAPDITGIYGQITLVNDRGDVLHPTLVTGRHMNYLTDIEENLWVKFALRTNGHHFLERSSNYFLVINGFESVIRLEYSTDLMK